VEPWVRQNRLDLLERLLPGIAHEINNTNQSILLAAQVLEGVWRDLRPLLDRVREREGDFVVGGLEYSDLRDELSAYLAQIAAGARKIEAVITEMRGVARGGGNDGGDRSIADVNQVVSGCLLLASHHIRRSIDNVEVALADGLPSVRGAGALIGQAVLNLLEHACVSAARRDQLLQVSTACDRQSGVVTFEVRLERGIGADAAPVLAPLDALRFDPLACARRVTDLLGGTLDAQAGDGGIRARLAVRVAG
jgi:two-component system, NtrC family, sensor kinase